MWKWVAEISYYFLGLKCPVILDHQQHKGHRSSTKEMKYNTWRKGESWKGILYVVDYLNYMNTLILRDNMKFLPATSASFSECQQVVAMIGTWGFPSGSSVKNPSANVFNLKTHIKNKIKCYEYENEVVYTYYRNQDIKWSDLICFCEPTKLILQATGKIKCWPNMTTAFILLIKKKN